MIWNISSSIALLLLCISLASGQQTKTATNLLPAEISFTRDVSAIPVDGQVFLLISKDKKNEPRFEIGESEIKSQQIFGVNVDGLGPDEPHG